MIVVTGAAGFIGSVLVDALNKNGYTDLLLVDHLGSEGKFKNLRAKSFRQIINPEAFLAGMKAGTYQPDAIFHMGAISDTSVQDADQVLHNNTDYTRDLAVLSMERKIRFIYASSASVYGDGALGFSDSDSLTPQFQPLNPYAFSKWLFDAEAIREGWTSQLVGLRFFNVFGPNEYHKGFGASVVWHSTQKIQKTGKLQLFQSHKEGYADGEQRRDFVYVQDIVKVMIWFLKHPEASGIFNVGAGQARTFNDLAAAIFSALGKEPQVEYIPTPETIRNAYQYFTEADLTRLRAAGYDAPFETLETAVADYVQNYLLKENPYL